MRFSIPLSSILDWMEEGAPTGSDIESGGPETLGPFGSKVTLTLK